MVTERAKNSTIENTKALVEQYKPLGLKAVVAAASQRKPVAQSVKRELPAGIKLIEA
ncbi:hypothetical protein IB238_03280 [Rhizobium sp. ARZ01]|uniref:hypothetical protein n=1 Tax=Rhizobium sp. ARZ01 TaxID=2769313 RepID=UPI00177D4830|nr:hypothetical protein [Rhizobium sp. ARZ01]MBD9371663.1 hypothetical protein [Rhizobium sp. ARZ01]